MFMMLLCILTIGPCQCHQLYLCKYEPIQTTLARNHTNCKSPYIENNIVGCTTNDLMIICH